MIDCNVLIVDFVNGHIVKTSKPIIQSLIIFSATKISNVQVQFDPICNLHLYFPSMFAG